MANETKTIIVISLLAGGFIVAVIGLVLWALKKKGGVLIAVIGVLAICSSLLFDPAKNDVQEVEPVEKLNFSECYYAYKSNELRADDTYKGNRYSLTAQVLSIHNTDDSLLYWDDEVIVQFEIAVDDIIAVGEALFEKEQAEALKEINVGDTITFIGECRSAGAWIDCELAGDK